MVGPFEKPEFSKKKAFPPSWNIISRSFAPYRTHLFRNVSLALPLAHAGNQMHITGANLCGNSIKPRATRCQAEACFRLKVAQLNSFFSFTHEDPRHFAHRKTKKICLRISSTENFLPARYRQQMRRFPARDDFDRTREVLVSSIDVCKQLFRMSIYY